MGSRCGLLFCMRPVILHAASSCPSASRCPACCGRGHSTGAKHVVVRFGSRQRRHHDHTTNTLPYGLRTPQVVLRRHDPFRHILLGHDEGAC